MPLFPQWLELSGLPQLLKEQTCGNAAWLTLRTIISIESQSHKFPLPVDIALAELSERAGVSPRLIRRSMQAFSRNGIAKAYIPESDEENSLIQIQIPIRVPRSHPMVLKLTKNSPAFQEHRYCECLEAQHSPSDSRVQETVDLYFNHISLAYNPVIQDRLTSLAHRFSADEIRNAFRRAEKNQSRSLGFVERELSRMRSPKKQEEFNDAL
jgi:hypothetical protein